MDPQVQSSFIPKQTKKVVKTKKRPGLSFPLFAVLAYALFVGSILSSAIVFVYNQYTDKKLQQSITALDQAMTSFRVTDFQNVVDFDNRLRHAKDLLDSHVSITQALSILEGITVQTVQVDKVELQRLDNQQLAANITAKTDDIGFLIFQRDVLRAQESGVIANSQISDIVYVPSTNTTGLKQFTFNINVIFSGGSIKAGRANTDGLNMFDILSNAADNEAFFMDILE